MNIRLSIHLSIHLSLYFHERQYFFLLFFLLFPTFHIFPYPTYFILRTPLLQSLPTLPLLCLLPPSFNPSLPYLQSPSYIHPFNPSLPYLQSPSYIHPFNPSLPYLPSPSYLHPFNPYLLYLIILRSNPSIPYSTLPYSSSLLFIYTLINLITPLHQVYCCFLYKYWNKY